MTYHTTEELIGGRSEWAVSPNNFNGLIDSHILANQRIAELEAQLTAYQPKDHWSTATKSLVMRLRGIYAVGPNADQMGADDKPEFGWRDYGQRPPIQYEAADRIAALETALQVAREALEHTKCRCQFRTKWECPQCGGKLCPISAPGWMNSEQWDAVKAGDFMCSACDDSLTRTGKKYWNDGDLPKDLITQCERCKALARIGEEVSRG